MKKVSMKQKQRRIKMFALIALIIFTVFLFIGLIPTGANAELYYRFANVVDYDVIDDVVVADDGLGNLWEFYGTDYFEYDDLIIMIMDDNETPKYIYDDEVCNAYTVMEGDY